MGDEVERNMSWEERKKMEDEASLTKDRRTIFVSQLTMKVNESTLRDFFGQLGKVNDVIMLRDKITGKHKGFAYVEMKDLDVINNCLLFNNVVPEFQKFPILVKGSEAEKNLIPTKEKLNADGSVPESRVYVGNLHPNVKQEDIKAILSEFGHVEYVNLHKDEHGQSKGFAFCRFSKPEEAQLAMNKLNGLVIGERPIKVAPVIDPATKQANLVAQAASTPGGNMQPGTLAMNSTVAPVPSYSAAVAQMGDVVPMQTGWKLDEDDHGMSLNANTRASLMAKLGQSAGIEVPSMPTMQMQMQMQNPATQ